MVSFKEFVLDPSVSCSVTLSSVEAIFAIGALTMASDGEIKKEELSTLGIFLADHALLQDVTPEAVGLINEKVEAVFEQEGPAVLFRAALDALDPQQRELAFSLAVQTALADQDYGSEEQDFLPALGEALGLDPNFVTGLLAPDGPK